MRPCMFRAAGYALTLWFVWSAHVFSPARAADYPDHTVKVVVPFPAGGTADSIPRIIADWLSRKWAQPVVVENRTGAAGNIGSELVCDQSKSLSKTRL
jgi:tripartite-type tricarboxylate transporter receptor subunit TctC